MQTTSTEISRESSHVTKKHTRLPGPRRYPVVGNLLQLSGNDMFYVKLNEFRKDYGDVLYLELGAMKMLVVFGHDEVKKILEDTQDRFKYRPSYLVEVKGLELFKGSVFLLLLYTLNNFGNRSMGEIEMVYTCC